MSRKLDAAIAEALGKRIPFPHAKHYSTDGNAMLELDREMRERGWIVEVAHHGVYVYAGYTGKYENKLKTFPATADTEPLARALAAYKALTGEDFEGERLRGGEGYDV